MRDSKELQAILNDFIEYNTSTGICTWKHRDMKYFKTEGCYKSWNTKYANTVINYISKTTGYITTSIFNTNKELHVFIHILMTGEFPKFTIDHKDTVKTNNSWDNLRDIPQSKNNLNKGVRVDNLLGIKGVTKNGKGFMARVKVADKDRYLGTFSTPELAKDAYNLAASELHLEFFRS
jgi:hypothetical protein